MSTFNTIANLRSMNDPCLPFKRVKPMNRFAKAILLLTAVVAATGAADPLTVEIETRDAERFARLFLETDGKPSAAQLQASYLTGSGKGVDIFTPDRIVNAENLQKSVAADMARYRHAIETCLPLAKGLTPEMRSIYLAYRGLVPERPLPMVYIVFGAGNSGGTASAGGQALGLEVMCGPGTTPEQFRTAMRSMFAHETVHTWQTYDAAVEQQDPLLYSALAEGVPDFLASLVTGTVPMSSRNNWALEREAWLWREFQHDRIIVRQGAAPGDASNADAGKATRRWFGNYQRAPEGWPYEAGYWVGMRIAQAYVARASDKQAAISRLIDLRDPAAILAQSGYDPR